MGDGAIRVRDGVDEPTAPGPPQDPRLPVAVFTLVGIGYALRVVLPLLAEKRLDCDESTVALMTLDILEHSARPMFFYGGAYNGGAAFELHPDASPILRATIVSRPGEPGGPAVGVRILTGDGLGSPVLEDNLFGHVRGAFTGAGGDKLGLLESADGGTVLFDEITTISPTVHADSPYGA